MSVTERSKAAIPCEEEGESNEIVISKVNVVLSLSKIIESKGSVVERVGD